MNKNQPMRFKISVVGDSGVGKTSLMRKFTRNSFPEDYAKTLGAQFSTYYLEIDGTPIRLIFWHIAAGYDFLFIRPSFYHNTSAAIILYSLEDTEQGKASFTHILDWYDKIMEFNGKCPAYIFANKVDLVDEGMLDETRLKKLLEENNINGYYLTSVKTGDNIIKAFNDISMGLYKRAKVKRGG